MGYYENHEEMKTDFVERDEKRQAAEALIKMAVVARMKVGDQNKHLDYADLTTEIASAYYCTNAMNTGDYPAVSQNFLDEQMSSMNVDDRRNFCHMLESVGKGDISKVNDPKMAELLLKIGTMRYGELTYRNHTNAGNKRDKDTAETLKNVVEGNHGIEGDAQAFLNDLSPKALEKFEYLVNGFGNVAKEKYNISKQVADRLANNK